MTEIPESIPLFGNLVHLFVEWGCLLLLSILILFLYKVRHHIFHPIAFVKKYRRRIVILLCFVALLAIAPPFLAVTFDLSFSMQTTTQNEHSSWIVCKSNSSAGLLEPRFIPWRRVGIIPVGLENREITDLLAAALAKQLLSVGQFKAVDVLSGHAEIDAPENAYDVFFAVRVDEYTDSDMFYLKSADATVLVSKLPSEEILRQPDVSYYSVGLDGTLHHQSTTKGICSKKTHRDMILSDIAKNLAENINVRMEAEL